MGLTVDERYQIYVAWCILLELIPATFERWYMLSERKIGWGANS